MRKRDFILLFMLIFCALGASAQETFPRNDVKDNRAGAYAFTNATIVVDYQTTLLAATLLVKSGKIEQVGTSVTIPSGYTTVDLKGKYVYPSLIDMYTSYGLSEIDRSRPGGNFWGSIEQIQPKTKGAYNANQAIRSHYRASDEFMINTKAAENLRNIGFGAVNAFKADGIARGTSAFVSLGEETENKSMLKGRAA